MKTLTVKHLKKTGRSLYTFTVIEPEFRGDTSGGQTGGTDPTNTLITVFTNTYTHPHRGQQLQR